MARAVWHLLPALRDLGAFLVRHLPARHRLVKGRFAEILLPGAVSFDGRGIAPDLQVMDMGAQKSPTRQGCAPVGTTVATANPSESDPALALALRIIEIAQSPARSDLRGAAKSLAATAAFSAPRFLPLPPSALPARPPP